MFNRDPGRRSGRGPLSSEREGAEGGASAAATGAGAVGWLAAAAGAVAAPVCAGAPARPMAASKNALCAIRAEGVATAARVSGAIGGRIGAGMA